ncbi:uncharacterized protein LOC118566991 [Fundulus heteroclitus]|uniref:uncharacterized protein LOC118566991 n=1 Tax=Fundulus heteroclitus TaxID=8078 RepID=UPI00165A4195|nr:uncharacterized protein LOC118566991 [Fundulus heteroclitus]
MVEVMGPNRRDLVFRAWTPQDIEENAKSLPDPTLCGEKFATAFTDFGKELHPTGAEIRRVLARKLRATELAKIHNKLPEMGLRVLNPDWDHADNQGFVNAVNGLAEEIKKTFPTKINMTSIYTCKRKADESTDDFIERVIECVTRHSGQAKPSTLGVDGNITVWEALVCDSVIKGLLPQVAEAFKAAYVGWAEEPKLSEVRKHTRHAASLVDEQKRTKKDKTEKKLHLAAISTYQYIGRGERDQKGRGRGGRNREILARTGEPGARGCLSSLWEKRPLVEGLSGS